MMDDTMATSPDAVRDMSGADCVPNSRNLDLSSPLWLGILGFLGLVSYGTALFEVQQYQCNVTTYAVETARVPFYTPPFLLGLVAFLLPLFIAARSVIAHKRHWLFIAASCWPLIGCAPLAIISRISSGAPSLYWIMLFILSAGCVLFAAERICKSDWARPAQSAKKASREPHRAALASIFLLIAVLVLMHTMIQMNFYDHFQLGHADIGHFAEELKNCLRGRGLRSDSFDNTRLGWHFTPLLFVLVPIFALWPSITLLMVCGALFVHLPALFIYSAARRRTGDTWVAWILGLAWLALPSLGRMVYSNTYGFQWDYATMPLLAAAFWAMSAGRWKVVIVYLACTALVVETANAAVMGVGIAILLFHFRRKIGAGIALNAIAYAALCTCVFIPYFAASGRYERADLFGVLGPGIVDVLLAPFRHPHILWERLARPQALGFVAMLLVPMCGLPLIGWRVAIAAVPTLGLVLILDNAQWLSIKFWYQETILVTFFFVCVFLLRPAQSTEESEKAAPAESPTPTPATNPTLTSHRSHNRALACAVLVCSLWGHYFFGFSPLSKSFELYLADASLHTPDARLAFIQTLRDHISPSADILATERMAAHFWDFHRIYTGRRIHPANYVIIDRSDTWDQSGLTDKWSEYEADRRYIERSAFGPIIVFQRFALTPPLNPGEEQERR